MAITRPCAELRKLVDTVDNERVFHVEQGGRRLPVPSCQWQCSTWNINQREVTPSPNFVIYWNHHVTEIWFVNN